MGFPIPICLYADMGPKSKKGIGPLLSISGVIYTQNSEQWPDLLL
jgi:hypothetical protein